MIYRSYFRLSPSTRRALELYIVSCLVLLCSALISKNLFLPSQAIIIFSSAWYAFLMYMFSKKSYEEAKFALYEKLLLLGVVTLYYALTIISTPSFAPSCFFKMNMVACALTFLHVLHTLFAHILKRQTSYSLSQFIATYYGSSLNISHFRLIRVISFIQVFAGIFLLLVLSRSYSVDTIGAFLLLAIPASNGIIFIAGTMQLYSMLKKELVYVHSPQSITRLSGCNTALVSLEDVLLEKQLQLLEKKTLRDTTVEFLTQQAALLATHSEEALFQLFKTVESSEIKAITREFPGKGIRGTLENQEWFLGTTKFMEELRFTTLEAKNDFKMIKKETKKQAQEGVIPIYLATPEKIAGYFLVRDSLKHTSLAFFSVLKEFFLHRGIMTPLSKEVAHSYGEKLEANLILHDLLLKKEASKIKQLHNEEYRIAVVATQEHFKALQAAHTSILLSSASNANADFCLDPHLYSRFFPLMCAGARALLNYYRGCQLILYGWISSIGMLLISSLVYPIFYVTTERALFLALLFSCASYGYNALFRKQVKRLRAHYKIQLPIPLDELH